MDLFDDVTKNYNFLCFSLKQKFVSMNRFIVRNLLTCEVSRKSVVNSRKYESPNLPIFTKKCSHISGQRAQKIIKCPGYARGGGGGGGWDVEVSN